MNLGALLRRYLAAGARHRWRALLLAWVVCLAGWAGVALLPNQYASTTRIYADADAILGLLLRGIAIDSSPAGQVETLQRTLLSRPNLEKIVSRTRLDARATSAAQREEIIDGLARLIRIRNQSRNLFTIEYQDSDPRLAHDVVQTALNLFLEAASVTDLQQMDNARQFVNQQLASYEVQLRQAERRRAEFQTQYIDILPNAALGGVSKLESARARLQQVQGELEDARRRRDLTGQQLQTATEAPPARFSGADPRVAEAERNLAALRLRFTDQHPDVRAAVGALAAMRASGGGGGARVAAPRENPALEMMRLRLVDAESQILSLERQEREGQAEVDRLDEIARSAPQVQAQFLNLDRDYNVLRRNYEELLARRESLQIAGAARDSSERVRLEIVDPPTMPTQPVAPNRLLLSAGVLVVGLGAGVGLVLLLMQFDRSFYTVNDLRRIGLPVLGAVSAPRRRGAGLATFGFASGVAMLLLTFGAVLAGAPRIIARMLA